MNLPSLLHLYSAVIYSNAKCRAKRLIVVIVLGSVVWFSNLESADSIGLSLPPTTIIRVQPRDPFEVKIAKIKKQLKNGIDPVQIESKSTKLRGNKVLIKGSHGRYLVETVGDQVNILGIGDCSNNIVGFQKLMNDMYDANLKY
jgi:hypothetical protein